MNRHIGPVTGIMLGLVGAVLFGLAVVSGVQAQVPGVTIDVVGTGTGAGGAGGSVDGSGASAEGTLEAFFNGESCGSVDLAAGGASLSLSDACAAAGNTLTFTLNGEALDQTLTIPDGGGNLTFDLSGDVAGTTSSNVVISVPGGAAGTVTALVNGEACGTVTVTPSTGGTITLPESCATAGTNVNFTLNGQPLAATVTVAGGSTLVLPNLAAPVTVQIPPGPAGTVSAFVDGQFCGSVNVTTSVGATLLLSANCVAVAAGEPDKPIVLTLEEPDGDTFTFTETLDVPAGGGPLVLSSTTSIPGAAPGTAPAAPAPGTAPAPAPASTGGGGELTQGQDGINVAMLLAAAAILTVLAGGTALVAQRIRR